MSQGGLPLLCTPLAANQVLIRVNNIPSGRDYINVIALRDVVNPAVTYGTGNFRLRILKGDYNEFDHNYVFGQVGFTANPASPSASSISILASTNEPNVLGTFKVSVDLSSSIISDQSSMRINVPAAITFDKTKVKVTTSPSLGTFTLDFYRQYIILSKITGQVPPSSLMITVENLQNLPYSGSTGSFTFELRNNGTQQMLEFVNLGAVTINSAVISSQNFIISSFDLDVNSISLYNSDTVYLEFTTKIKNSLPDDCSVVLSYPAALTVLTCWPLDNMVDLSETSRISCAIAGNQVVFTNLKSIYKDKNVKFAIKATLPAAAGATGNFQVATYYDNAALKAVDSTPYETLTISKTFAAAVVTVPTASIPSNTILAALDITFSIPVAMTTYLPKIYLSGQFSNTATGNVNCQLYKNAVLVSTTTCSAILNNKNFLEINVIGLAASSVATSDSFNLKLLPISSQGIKSPLYAGEYFVQVVMIDGSTETAFGTGFFLVQEKDFTPSLVSIKAFTKDFSHKSVYDFSLYMPFAIEQGQWSSKDKLGLTYFELIFLKTGFDTNFYTDYPLGSVVPCYGIVGIRTYGSETSNNLKCTIKDNTIDNAYSIFVKGYGSLDSEGLVRIHIPGLYNPANNTAGSVIVRVYREFKQTTTLILKTSFTMGNAVNQDIFDNPKNTAGTSGTTSNVSPQFVPNQINKESYTEVKFTPSKSISSGGGLILFFPQLPTTSPQHYILPPQSKITCLFQNAFLDCYSYFEAGTILIENIPAIPANNEVIIRIAGFTNAPYVVDLHASIEMWSYSALNIEVERFLYTELSPLDYGSINDAYVLPYEYQSLRQDVTYDWVFRLTNDVPYNGKIVLFFPANYYDLESSSPCPSVELVEGATWIDPLNNPNVAAATTCSSLFATSIATVSQINPVKKDDVVVFRFKGVKNPSQEGWTPYFQIETRNQEDYIIDRIQTIPQVYITRKFDVKTIVFDGFYTSPDNGKLLGNYYLSFYPQSAIPKYGIIEVTFPAAEFDPTTDWPVKQVCRVGGSLKTFSRCVWSATTPVIQIYLDEKLEIEPGMEPVRIEFPHIFNFNAELSSGVVKVTTSYDGLNLDESGTDETNRKATTSKEAKVLTVTSFDYYPRNEGNMATYKFSFQPVENINSTGVILVEFPYQFPKGLGDNIVCRSSQLLVSSLDPLKCTVDQWKLNITNHKGWTCGNTLTPQASCSIDIEIFGIINPNKLPAITDQISVYIFYSSQSVSEYTYGLGALAFTNAPQPVFERWGAYSNMLPRKIVNANHLLFVTSAVTGANKVNCHFPKEYDSTVLSPSLMIKSKSSNSFSSVSYYNNSVYVTQSYSLAVGVFESFEMSGLSQPYELGQTVPLYTIEFEDTTAKSVLAKTYPNLINRSPINYTTTEVIITVNNDQYIYLAAGTYSDSIPVVAAIAPASDIVVSLTSNDPDLNLFSGQSITIKAGETTAYFRIGYDLFSRERKVWVKFTITSGKIGNGGNTYADLRPLKVILYPSTEVGVKITDFAALAAGGRSVPLALYLDKGPFKELTVGIFQIGRIPDLMGIYPKSLTFLPGEKKHFFWLSTDTSSKGSQGSIVFTLTGDTRSVYNFPLRQKDFYIYEGRDIPPVILYQKIVGPTSDNKLKISIITDSHCTLYFAVFPRGTLDLTFSEIRKKRMRYDNYQEKFKLGEVVFENEQNLIDFEIPDLESGKDQTLKLFIQNTDGVLAEAIYFPFSTVKPQPPMKVYLQASSDSNKVSILSAINSGISAGSRFKADKPDSNFYFEEKKVGESKYPIPYPNIDITADQQKKKDDFLAKKNKQEDTPEAVSSSTSGIGSVSIGGSASSAVTTTTKTAGVGDSATLQKLNEKTQSVDTSIDTGKSATTISQEAQKIDRFRSKEVIPMVVGQEISSQEQ